MNPTFHLYGMKITLAGDLQAAMDRSHLARLLMFRTKLVNVNNLDIIQNNLRLNDGTHVHFMSQHGLDSATIYVPPKPAPTKPRERKVVEQYLWPAFSVFSNTSFASDYLGVVLCKGGGFNPPYEFIPTDHLEEGEWLPEDGAWSPPEGDLPEKRLWSTSVYEDPTTIDRRMEDIEPVGVDVMYFESSGNGGPGRSLTGSNVGHVTRIWSMEGYTSALPSYYGSQEELDTFTVTSRGYTDYSIFLYDPDNYDRKGSIGDPTGWKATYSEDGVMTKLYNPPDWAGPTPPWVIDKGAGSFSGPYGPYPTRWTFTPSDGDPTQTTELMQQQLDFDASYSCCFVDYQLEDVGPLYSTPPLYGGAAIGFFASSGDVNLVETETNVMVRGTEGSAKNTDEFAVAYIDFSLVRTTTLRREFSDWYHAVGRHSSSNPGPIAWPGQPMIYPEHATSVLYEKVIANVDDVTFELDLDTDYNPYTVKYFQVNDVSIGLFCFSDFPSNMAYTAVNVSPRKQAEFTISTEDDELTHMQSRWAKIEDLKGPDDTPLYISYDLRLIRETVTKVIKEQ